MLPVYEIIFDKRTPRISPKDETDLLHIGNWFGKDLFTYVCVFGSLFNPHVLPLFVPKKLLSRKIAYQNVGNGISKVLEESNNKMWHVFPTQRNIYALDNFKHASIEINNILELNFPTIPKIQHDPHQYVRKVTATSRIMQFTHDPDKFNGLFKEAYTYSVVMIQAEE